MISAGVKSHSYSQPLQRVLVDFGAEDAFNRVHAKLKGHYGISVPFSAPREVTVKHAVNIMELQQELIEVASASGEPKCSFGNPNLHACVACEVRAANFSTNEFGKLINLM